MSLPIPQLLSLDSTLGAILIGAFFSLIIYGTSLHQAYRYARVYPEDKRVIRVLVCSLLVLDTAQVVCIMHVAYNNLVTNYANPENLLKSIWSINMIPLLASLITFTSQISFVRRVYLVGSKHQILAALSLLFLIGKSGTALVMTAQSFSKVSKLFDPVQVKLTLGFATGADILLSSSLFVVHKRSVIESNGQRHKSVPDIISTYAMNTGLLILAFDFVSLILAVVRPKDLYWAALYIVSARLDTATLLNVLNSRRLLISRTVDVELLDKGAFGRSIIARANRLATAEQWNVPRVHDDAPPAMIDIKVTTEVEGARDIESSTTGTLEEGHREKNTAPSI